MKTTHLSSKDIKRNWHEFDAEGKVLGRLASEVATLLMGKHKRTYSPHMDNGDYVIVKNAKKVMVTGNKETQKVYYKHSNYPSGLKTVKLSKLREEQPEKIIEHAVRGMLPKNRTQDIRMRRLKVIAGESHAFKNKLKNGKKEN